MDFAMGRFARFGSALVVGSALAFGAGCSADQVEEESEEADSSQSDVSTARTSGGSFITIEFGDKVVGDESGVVAASATRSYGIGAVGSYMLKQNATGELLGVITGYERKTGRPLIEVVTNLKTGQTGFVMAESFRPTVATDDGMAKPAFMEAFKKDLQRAEKSVASGGTVKATSSSIHPQWWWGSSTSCTTKALASIFTGVLGAGAFITATPYFFVGGLLVSYGGASAAATAAVIGLGVGMVAGVVLAGIGVVTLGYTAVVCLAE